MYSQQDVKRNIKPVTSIKLDPYYAQSQMKQNLPFQPPIFKDKTCEYWRVKLEAYLKPRVHYSVTEDEFRHVKRVLLTTLEQYIGPTRVYDLDEVVEGIEGVSESMTLNTSPSWPLTNRYKTKREALESQEVCDMIALQWDDWLSDNPVAIPVLHHAKDELLPLEKVFKPRPFYSVDAITNANSARLVADFNNQAMGHVQSPLLMGFNPMKGGIHALYQKHDQRKYHLPGDISAMDASKQLWMSRMKIEIRAHFFAKHYSGAQLDAVISRLRSMYSALDQAYCIASDGKFHARFGQTVTGHRATLEDNSLDMWMVFELAFLRMQMQEKPIMSIVGDDSILSVNNQFCLSTFVSTLKTIGYTYTPPTKTSTDYAFVPLEEVEFLKFRFWRSRNGRYVARYNEDRILAILKYQKHKDLCLSEKLNSCLIMTCSTPQFAQIHAYAMQLVQIGAISRESLLTPVAVSHLVHGFEGICNADPGIKLLYYKYKPNLIKFKQALINTTAMEDTVAAENPVEGDMFATLHADNEVQTHAPVTHKPGEALVRKLLHPPSSVPEFCGLPTNDARSQVCLEWRNMELMNTPYVFDVVENKVRALTPEEMKDLDLAFLIPNGARVKSIAFVKNPSNGVMTQDLNNAMIEQLYNFKSWPRDVNLYRSMYKSTTFYLNATMFNNTGMVVGNQFNPNILFAGTLLTLAHSNPELFYALVQGGYKRGHFKKTTAVNRTHVEHWERFPHYHRTELLRRLNMSPNDMLHLDPNTNHQVIGLGRLGTSPGIQNVPSTSQILGNSMRSLGTQAREGMFSIQRLNTISPAWQAGSNTFDAPADYEYTGLYQCWSAEVEGVLDNLIVQPYEENAPEGTVAGGTHALYDTLWTKDMTWSWVRFSGLSVNISGPTTQLLIKKTYCGYEVQPCMASAWAGMMKLGPKPDLAAMQAMMDGFFELKDVMPARYNFWGTIASLAAKGLKTFGTGILTNMLQGTTKKGAKSGVSKAVTAAKKVMSTPGMRRKRDADTSRVAALERRIADLTTKLEAVGMGGQQQRRRGNNGNSGNSREQRKNRGVPVDDYIRRRNPKHKPSQ